MALKLYHKRWYPYIFISASVAVIAAWLYFSAGHRPELLFSAVGAVGGLTYFLYRQHLDETRLFKELFVEFNDRYARLNEGLNKILFGSVEGELSTEERDVLFSYFNLCSEEYLFYKAGYFDSYVWSSWYRGMQVFFDHPRVRALWEQDSKADSYYGFRPPLFTTSKAVPSNQTQGTVRGAGVATWQAEPRQKTSPQSSFSVSSHFSFAPRASTDWAQQFVDVALSYQGVTAYMNAGGVGFDPNFVFIERIYTEDEGFIASFYGSPDEFAKYGCEMKPGRSNSYSRLSVRDKESVQTAVKCLHISANLKSLDRL